ncbi:universal stress protein [Bradyrhizobium sp.]|jgi:nucleotide-binding universal stress UspA family protein|uniref:universal stress protein n=1 Tax=Bradyrhizobium sp. TaxID=376 RepID=UPI00359FDEE4
MYGALKDVAVIIDGEDPLVDAVQAGVALRLAHHHGAHVKVFEQGGADRLGQLAWIDDLELPPYAGVEICGISHEPPMGRHGLRSPLSELLHEARQSGHWGKRAETNELLQALRCTDLVVAGSPLTSEVGAKPDPEDIVTRVGRPVLIIPRKFAQRRSTERRIGHRVLIAWDASAPSARAVHDAMPFLRQAEEITLLYVDRGHDRTKGRHIIGPIADHLASHDVKVQSEIMPAGEAGASKVILERLGELDINLLVMGAYSRSRLAESWFGGVSEELLHAAQIAILTSH